MRAAVTLLDNRVFMATGGERSSPTERHSQSNLWGIEDALTSSDLNNSQAISVIAELRQCRQKQKYTDSVSFQDLVHPLDHPHSLQSLRGNCAAKYHLSPRAFVTFVSRFLCFHPAFTFLAVAELQMQPLGLAAVEWEGGSPKTLP